MRREEILPLSGGKNDLCVCVLSKCDFTLFDFDGTLDHTNTTQQVHAELKMAFCHRLCQERNRLFDALHALML